MKQQRLLASLARRMMAVVVVMLQWTFHWTCFVGWPVGERERTRVVKGIGVVAPYGLWSACVCMCLHVYVCVHVCMRVHVCVCVC